MLYYEQREAYCKIELKVNNNALVSKEAIIRFISWIKGLNQDQKKITFDKSIMGYKTVGIAKNIKTNKVYAIYCKNLIFWKWYAIL